MEKSVDLTMEATQTAASTAAQHTKPTKLQVALSALEAYVASSTWSEAKRVVEVYYDLLLTDVIDDVLVALIGQYEDVGAIRMLTQHRKVLARCRADGVDVAFADLLTERDTCPPGVDLTLWRRVLLADSYVEVMALLAEHLELIPHISRRIARMFDRQQRQLLYALGALLDASSWYEVKEIIGTYPALLSLDADIWLSQCAAALVRQSETEAVRVVLERRWVLADCRLKGVEAAFSERLLICDGVFVDLETDPVLNWAFPQLAQAV